MSSGILGFVTDVTSDALSAVTQFALNVPKASNYFFKYLVVRSLSSAAGELVQIGTLIGWFIIGSIRFAIAISYLVRIIVREHCSGE